MLFVLRLAAFCTSFSSILPCVLQQNALHLAPKRSAFSGILYSVQYQNALLFAANGPKTGAKGGCFGIIFILPHSQPNLFLQPNQPSRESIFWDKVGGWWVKMALFVLKFLPKSGQSAGWWVAKTISIWRGKLVGWPFQVCQLGQVCWLFYVCWLCQACQLYQVYQLFQVNQLFQAYQLFQVCQLFQVHQVFQLYQPNQPCSFIARHSHLFS